MRAVYKAPGKKAELVDVENELSALQKAVGGYLESVTLATDCCILCDEEGRLKGLPHNCVFCGVDFCGPILIVGVDGEKFADLAYPERFLGGAFAVGDPSAAPQDDRETEGEHG